MNKKPKPSFSLVIRRFFSIFLLFSIVSGIINDILSGTFSGDSIGGAVGGLVIVFFLSGIFRRSKTPNSDDGSNETMEEDKDIYDEETLQEFEKELRAEMPDLAKLDIDQLYILKGLNRVDISKAFRDLEVISCPSTDKNNYTVKIPAEKANEYSWYLSICDAFNQIRMAGYTQVNVAQLPNICSNKIILNNRSMKLEPNHYLFTKGNERA